MLCNEIMITLHMHQQYAERLCHKAAADVLVQYSKMTGAGEGVEKTCRKVSHAFVQGLTWVLAYYVHGNTPVPVSKTHASAVAAAENQQHGKGKQSSAADSAEGLGASWDW